MIRCIIVDDEPLAQEVLEAHILRYGHLEIVAKCAHALEAFDVLHKEAVDLMFLDIRMPSISGIDFLQSLKNPPKVIFTTAYTEYGHKGFELDAVDYLLKPVSYERFEKSMQKLIRMLPDERPEGKSYTYFKVSGKLIKVHHEDLMYAQSVKDYIMIKTTKGSLLTHLTMKSLTELLPGNTFIRVHRSYLVNIAKVDRVDRTCLKLAGAEIPIGENYRDSVWKHLK
ncbi:response regulator [Terrimonas sp. NA20]|uniref:Response regulator n=1 Tax=Terrimonas ginsenosidimutans TaxID=2908004 RepID=A0ABS9KUF8_9BACT|nr:response regulator [Terrimonas ginsenosidimutans]MCG2615941.1 response regulator [Terrimonas ginsenosidimutans]